MAMQENVIAYQVSIHRWGIKRQVPQVVLEGLIPSERELIKKKMLSASKRIIESKEYDKIVSRDGFASRWLAEHSVPSILRKGVYCIPTLFVNEVDDYMLEYKNERQFMLVLDFINVYEEQAYAARDALGQALFDSLEYPTVQKMETLFSVDTAYISFDVPESLAYVSEALFRREQERVKEQWVQAEEAVNQLLVEECVELVTGLQTALTGLSDGTVKVFRDANISNLLEWAELFSRARNVTNNQELGEIVEQIKGVLQGVSQKNVKYNAGNVRQHVGEMMAGIQVALKGMLEPMAERLVEFTE